jgi:biopolymer transport protein ExbB
VSSEYPNRGEFLTGLIEKLKGDALPTIEEIERVWFEMQREMIESGRIVQYNTTVATPAGDDIQADVVRVGSFNIVTTDGQYLKYSDDALSILPRQPASSFVGWAEDLANSTEGYGRFGVDPTGPTGGSLLAAFIDTPTLTERWHQGRQVGYVITAVGIIAMLIAAWRFVVLTAIGAKVNAQLKSSTANTDNPLGRVLVVADENPNMDTETLELKLNEAVLKEIPGLENSLTLIKIIAAVAPLLGLLGTVTGMIITFQAITIFGAGDPKTMASGISSALITTVLGLIVAIPTLLAHTIVSGRAKRVIHVLEEQAAGIIARNAESK